MSDFTALRNRHLAASRKRYRYIVRPLNKDGTMSRAPLTETDWQLNAFTNESDASVRVHVLEALNPGRRFVVAPL